MFLKFLLETVLLVHINNMRDATHWETYAIPGEAGKGEICLNGCPAHLFKPGDEIIILSLALMTPEQAKQATQQVVHVDKKNKITGTRLNEF